MDHFIFLGREIPMYGLMIVIGIVAGCGAGLIIVKKKKLSEDNFIILAAYAFGFGMLGAKVLYIFVMRNNIEFNRIFEKEYFQIIMSGGFVFYGGLFGGLFGVFLAGRIHKINVLPYLYGVIPCLPLIHGFGRIGCSFAGCCYGIPYDGIFHITYTHANSFAPHGIMLFPVQLLEGMLNFLLSGVLLYYVYKKGLTYKTVVIYILCYGVMRFFLEYLRYDDIERGNMLIFSTSQWISLFLVLSVFLFLLVRNIIKKHH